MPINQLHPDYFYSNGNLYLGEMSLGIISDAISLEVFLTGRGNSLPAIDLSVTKYGELKNGALKKGKFEGS